MKKLRQLKRATLFSLMAFSIGCGVKGDPIAPESPPELGRGRPTYRRATEPLAFPVVPPPTEKQEDENQNDY